MMFEVSWVQACHGPGSRVGVPASHQPAVDRISAAVADLKKSANQRPEQTVLEEVARIVGARRS